MVPMQDDVVDVYVYGALQRRFGVISALQPVHRGVPIGPDDRIRDVVAALGIRPDEVSHLFLNAEYSAASRRVKPGDRLAIFGRDMALLYRQYFPKVEDSA